MSERYAIRSLDEAGAYLAHPVLGARPRECVSLINEFEGRTIDAIFGHPDDFKFRSSITLFAQAASENDVFVEALRIHFGAHPHSHVWGEEAAGKATATLSTN